MLSVIYPVTALPRISLAISGPFGHIPRASPAGTIAHAGGEPTGILFWALATTVSGSSSNKRAGELSLVTRGLTARVELISIWI